MEKELCEERIADMQLSGPNGLISTLFTRHRHLTDSYTQLPSEYERYINQREIEAIWDPRGQIYTNTYIWYIFGPRFLENIL